MTFNEWFEKFKKEHRRMCTPTNEAMEIMYHSIVDSIQQPQWQPPETAPKDGTLFLGNFGYLWVILAAWNKP